MEISYNLDNIEAAAAEFWQFAKQYKVWALNGDLGAGKTTFVSAVCRYLGADTAASSPTFSLVNEYHFTGPDEKETVMFHADWYRLGSTDEAINAGMEDMLEHKEAYCVVEWPARAPELLPASTLYVHFTIRSETGRVLTIVSKEMS